MDRMMLLQRIGFVSCLAFIFGASWGLLQVSLDQPVSYEPVHMLSLPAESLENVDIETKSTWATDDPSTMLAYARQAVAIPTKATSVVPLKNTSNALMVDATLVNGRTGQAVSGTFIIDTGATYTSISKEMADSLGLDLDQAESIGITTANGRIYVPKAVIDRVRVSGLEAKNIEVTVIPIRKGSSFSGLLGLSFIKQFRMTIDPFHGHLIFQPI